MPELNVQIRNLVEYNLQPGRLAVCCLFIFLASFLLYSPTLQFDFARYDDYKIIGEHPQLYSDGTVAERVAQIVYLDFPREEPLIVRDFSWLADSLIFGFNRPFGYHYGNVIYHSMTLVLAFLLLLRLTNPAVAFGSVSLLMVLAAHIEPVAWIMGRKDILSALFLLLCILLFLRFQSAPPGGRKLWFYGAALLCAGAAYLSKINSVTLPGVLFLCALMTNHSILVDGFDARNLFRILGRTLAQVMPFFLLGLLIFFWYQSVLTDYGLFRNALKYTPGDYLKLVGVINPLVLIEYLKMVLVPWNLEAFYSQPSLFREFSGFEIFQAAMVIVLGVAAIVMLWRINRISCLLLLCFGVAMLPYMNWVHLGFWYANRYVYFAAIFLVAAICNFLVVLMAHSGKRFVAVASGMFLAWVFAQNLVYRSQYIGVWENGETLWTHEIGMPGASIQDFNNLTANYIGEAESSAPDERKQWLQKASEVNRMALALDVPAYEQQWIPISHYYRGLILAYSGAPLEDQLVEFLEAVNNSPNFALALKSTGVVYYQMAMREEDPSRRTELAENSLFYLQRAFKVTRDDARSRRERLNLLNRLKSDFPELPIAPPSEAGSS